MRISDWSSDVCSSDLSQIVEQGKNTAQVEADRIVAKAHDDVEREVAHAREDLRKQVGDLAVAGAAKILKRSEEHTSELQSLMRTTYAVFCLTTKNTNKQTKLDKII